MSDFGQVCPDCRYEGAATFLCAACDEANMDDDNHALYERRAMLAERTAVVKFRRRIRLGYSGFTEEALSLVTAAIERGEHHK